MCVKVAAFSLLQNGLPLPTQRLPATCVLQQVDGKHLSYSEVKETGDEQEDDCGGKRQRVQ